MSQNQEIQHNNKSLKPDFELDPETIKSIVTQQGRKLEIEAQKLRLEEKRLEQDGSLPKNPWKLTAALLKIIPLKIEKQF